MIILNISNICDSNKKLLSAQSVRVTIQGRDPRSPLSQLCRPWSRTPRTAQWRPSGRWRRSAAPRPGPSSSPSPRWSRDSPASCYKHSYWQGRNKTKVDNFRSVTVVVTQGGSVKSLKCNNYYTFFFPTLTPSLRHFFSYSLCLLLTPSS